MTRRWCCSSSGGRSSFEKMLATCFSTAPADPWTAQDIVGLLRAAVDELHRTVVVITPDPSVAAVANRALLLDRGRQLGVVEAPSTRELTATLHDLGTAVR